MNEPLIRIENLYKDYITGAGPVHVLKGIDLRIDRGEFVAIMGPSGSGKSTFMNIVGCLDTPTSGDYWLDGQNVATLNANRLAEVRNLAIGFVFQGFNLLARVSAEDNVALPLLYAGVSRSERRRRALALLERVGLAQFAHHMPNQLSGGQQQRIAIARAMINEPRLILADEPTGNLDTGTSHEIMDLFTALNRDQNITIVLVTHEADVARYAHRLVRFLDGNLEGDGPTEKLLAGVML
ncbi:MAG: ABC transporter ATP-binding protein [Gammaproteobacteria bacterium]|jgi:putative ABC transport system ATP-binding protein